jgi:hypothetical protein
MARAKSLFHSANHAINVLARLAARNAIKEQLRDQGVRVTLVPIREITERAQVKGGRGQVMAPLILFSVRQHHAGGPAQKRRIPCAGPNHDKG